jgi:hypothetical protein
MSELIIAELWQDNDCIARWTDADGPPDLADRLPRLRERGWTVHDFRESAGPVRPDEEPT